MTDQQILIWIHQRLVKVHGENTHVDYMHRFREAIAFAMNIEVPKGRVLNYSSAVLDHINKLENPNANIN